MTLEVAEAPAPLGGATRDESLSAALPRVGSWVLPVAAGVAGFGVYAATLSPTVGILDSPELSAAAITLGVPHPTGYPLFVLLGHGWQALVGWLVGGDPAWRLNLLTALCGALAMGTIASVGRRLTGRASAGWLAAGVFGFSPGFWAQTNVVEVYALHTVFAAAILALWLRFESAAEDGADVRPALRRLALVVGLSLTHHLMTALLLPVIAISLASRWRSWWSPGELLRIALLALAPLGLYAYLPIVAASDPLVNWGNPETLAALWQHVSGAQYHANLAAPTDGFWATAGGYVSQLGEQLGWPFLPLAAIGCWQTGSSHRVTGLLALGYATAAAFGLSYGVVDSEPFHLNAQLIVALWIGAGAAFALRQLSARSPRAGRVLEAGLYLAPLVAIASSFADLDRRDDYTPHDHAVAVLARLPEDAVLLTQGPAGYPPVYAQLVQNLRPDVDVVDMYLNVRNSYGPELDRLRRSRLPDGVTRELALADTVSNLDGGRRSLWLMPGVPDFPWEEVGLQRIRGGLLDELVRSRPNPRIDLPTGPGVDFARGFSFLGFGGCRRDVEQGAAVDIELHWRLGDLASVTSDSLTVTVVLAGEDGTAPTGRDGLPLVEQKRPLAGGLSLDGTVPGDAISERASLLVPRTIEPGTWWLWVSLRDGEDWLELPDGRLFTRAGPIVVTPRKRPLWTLPGRREMPD